MANAVSLWDYQAITVALHSIGLGVVSENCQDYVNNSNIILHNY